MNELPKYLLALVVIGAAAFSLARPTAGYKDAFFSDEATYHMMAYSLAYDGDLRYQVRDLSRVYELGYSGGPSGVFLKRESQSGRLYYAKPFAYSLAAAPFVRVLADDGFLLLHALLLGLVLVAGTAYLERTLSPGLAAIYTLTYFGASVCAVYFFWITPEWFNLSVLFLAVFLWLYKEDPPAHTAFPGAHRLRWLTGAWTDVAAAVLFGVVTYSKPPTAIVAAAFFAWLLSRRRWPSLAAGVVAFLVVLTVMFGVNAATTGEWNYQGGDRKTYQADTGYPHESPAHTFDSVGIGMATDIDYYNERIPRLDTLAADLVYVWIGRNGGLLIYMFPAVLAALMFLSAPKRSLWGPHGFVLAAFAASILTYLLMVQGNWIGGGGAIGSRYFLSVYPLLFFLIPATSSRAALGVAASWLVAAVFLSPILINPLTASTDPSLHTKTFPFRLLPAELTMLNSLPFNIHPSTRRVRLDPDDDFFVYFLDDNTYGREGSDPGFWVKMGRRAEIVIRTPAPASSIDLSLRNGPNGPNVTTAALNGALFHDALDAAETARVTFAVGGGFRYGDSWVYRAVIRSAGGFVPKFYGTGSSDFRALGVFVEIDVEYPGKQP